MLCKYSVLHYVQMIWKRVCVGQEDGIYFKFCRISCIYAGVLTVYQELGLVAISLQRWMCVTFCIMLKCFFFPGASVAN